MDAKLIKTEVNYLLKNEEGVIIASTSLKKEGLSLSLKNCQTIERGYDLDELAKKYTKEADDISIKYLGKVFGDNNSTPFKDGAKAIIEILGDKKFTEEDMAIMMLRTAAWTNDGGEINAEKLLNDTIQSLQQTEWDCIIEMERYPGLSLCAASPELDTDGCIILKRK